MCEQGPSLTLGVTLLQSTGGYPNMLWSISEPLATGGRRLLESADHTGSDA